MTQWACRRSWSGFYFELSDREDVANDGAFANSGSWHVYARLNWGELADDITHAHQRYRWYNQATFAENYMPRALGWWSIDNANEWRWALSKAASFDAGFAYSGGASDAQRYGVALREEIRAWQDARLSGAFDDHNKMMMRRVRRALQARLCDPQRAGGHGVEAVGLGARTPARSLGAPAATSRRRWGATRW